MIQVGMEWVHLTPPPSILLLLFVVLVLVMDQLLHQLTHLVIEAFRPGHKQSRIELLDFKIRKSLYFQRVVLELHLPWERKDIQMLYDHIQVLMLQVVGVDNGVKTYYDHN